MIRGSIAVLAGFVLMNVITGLLAAALTALFPAAFPAAPVPGTAVAAAGLGWALVSLVYSSGAAFAGGYITAVVAGENAARSVYALVFTTVALGVFALVLSDRSLPAWYLVALLVLTAPSILLGGWFHQARSSA